MARAASAAALRIFAFFAGAAVVAPADALADVPGTITQLSVGDAAATQNSPAISGTQVVWTHIVPPTPIAPANFDIIFRDLLIDPPVNVNLTNTLNDREFLEDIDAGNVVWTHTGTMGRADIWLLETATGVRNTIAISETASFQRPTIRANWVTFLRAEAGQIDVDLLDYATSISYRVTWDAPRQDVPRVGSGNYVVYEDYSSGTSNVLAKSIPAMVAATPDSSFSVPAIEIAVGAGDQRSPDIDGDTVVYIDNSSGTDQVWVYDLGTRMGRRLTTVASDKEQPRVSGSRVVWSDYRNGNWDLFMYDLLTDREDRLVVGPGHQFLSDIDGDRIVYTDNYTDTGVFEHIMLFTITAPPPPPLPYGCDPSHTIAVSAPTKLTRTGFRPVFAEGAYTEDDPTAKYYVCIENGRADGSARATQVLFTQDRRPVLTPAQFKPNANPPRFVAARLDGKSARSRWARLAEGSGEHTWTAALYGRNPPNQITITIRKSR